MNEPFAKGFLALHGDLIASRNLIEIHRRELLSHRTCELLRDVPLPFGFIASLAPRLLELGERLEYTSGRRQRTQRFSEWPRARDLRGKPTSRITPNPSELSRSSPEPEPICGDGSFDDHWPIRLHWRTFSSTPHDGLG